MAGNELTVRVDPAAIKEATEEAVRIAMAQAIGSQKDAIVRAVVDAALMRPKQGRILIQGGLFGTVRLCEEHAAALIASFPTFV
jgi:hypothetical protein